MRLVWRCVVSFLVVDLLLNVHQRQVHGFASTMYHTIGRSSSSSFVTGHEATILRRQDHSTTTTTTNSRHTLSMKIKVGIVGLPNIGKSTLFNALVQTSMAQAENFPFCTIEPNLAPIAVPDLYLERLGALAQSRTTIPAMMEFVDVAGLVAGASRGEGLGNRFLATIRECHAICHVVRYFESDDIVHVDGRVDALQDAEVINLELVLADVSHVERRLEKITGGGDRDEEERIVLEKLLPELQQGIPARAVGLSDAEAFSIKSMGLLTLKPVIYVFNIDEVDFLLDPETTRATIQTNVMNKIQYASPQDDLMTVVSAKVEAEIAALPDVQAQRDYLDSMGVELLDDDDDESSSLDNIMSYSVLPNMVRQLLHLSLIYTGPGVPPEKSRTTKAYLYGNPPPTTWKLAGRLHGEIQRGFMQAQVASAATLLEHDSYTAAKDAGVVRGEGKDAVLQDGDVVLIKWK